MLNKFGPSGHGEAQVQYLDGDFRVISPGTYVRCAMTDARIPLDELKYWSVDLQEAYSVPTAVLQRHFPGALKLTPDQVALLRSDNVVSDTAKAAGLTLEGLGIAPDSLEAVAPQYLWRFRKTGQFAHKGA